jgi:hypothetical protein
MRFHVARFRNLVALGLVALASLHCARAPESEDDVAELRHAGEAPRGHRDAIAATVLVGSAVYGTGFFVNGTGLLVTNNHVLGAERTPSRCSAEGCWVTLYFDYERGKKPSKRDVFLKPLRASLALDISVFQAFVDQDERQRLSTPRFVDLDEAAEPSVDEKAHVIGHPASGLKRWSSGAIFETRGAYFRTEAFVLQGNSGGPVLDDDGRLLGIVHHASSGHENLASRGVRKWAEGTSSPWVRAMVYDPPAGSTTSFPSVLTERTEEDVVRHVDVYWLARKKDVALVGGARAEMLDVLGRSCDQALKEPLPAYDDFGAAHSACYSALKWINCGNPKEGASYKRCPVDEKAAWQRRFDLVAERAWQSGVDVPYGSVLAASLFEANPHVRSDDLDRRLGAYLRKHRPALNPSVAYYVLAVAPDVSAAAYGGKSMQEYVLNYRRIPSYAQYYRHLIHSGLTLFRRGALPPGALRDLAAEMLADPALPLTDRLLLEEELYLENLL